ncbi:RNA polymerase sigma factor SigJ [uncultured Roseobacter sp.]|uniref:RNA polymerase sigma factor SigJ n=1 Tax=uncultured Roseobacter sp. TaxID=114847 RepID=UPI00261D26D6|nr:RNA polymerase sigma factor SigJ [uncultured Roseobacter sp.]
MYRSTELTSAEIAAFENMRPRLAGLAYRILGSLSDAEDAVQDTFLKWAATERAAIANTNGWLVTACTRRCLDMRRTGDRARVDYVGAWLPEPIQLSSESDAEKDAELTSNRSMAFLMMLERLTPKERAAFLLHDIFELSHADVAETLDTSEASSRKLVSRARGNVGRAVVRHSATPDRQMAFLSAFKTAVTEGRIDDLSRLLAEDARLSADGGGKVPAILQSIEGSVPVCAFASSDLRTYWADHDWVLVNLNGMHGALIKYEGRTTAALSFAFDDDAKIRDIYIVRNPDKLAHLDAVHIH